MKIAVVGSRDFPDQGMVVDFVASLPPDWTVVSGGARGPDRWAIEAARQLGMLYVEHLAQWETLGKAAGLERNKVIADDSDVMVGFWDGSSRGTLHAISQMQKRRKAALLLKSGDRLPSVDDLRQSYADTPT